MKAKFHQSAVLALLLGLVSQVRPEPVPEPIGPYNVGARRLVIDFVNPDDPTAPNNISTEYMATIYYPTEDAPGAPSPYVEPELAQMYADVYDFNISHLTTTVRWHASFLPKPAGPTIIFSPGGWGPPTDGSSILLADLASQGYVVAALDHPYEQPFLRYPNGTGLAGLPINFQYTEEFVYALHAVRVREMVHFAGYWPELVRRMCAPFETKRLGAFGISFGGSASLDAALESDAIGAAINLDGSIFGRAAANEPDSDIKKPTLLLAFWNHSPSTDGSWADFVARQSGWWRNIMVNGTVHADWSDMTFWKIWGTSRPMGTIDGRRMVQIRSAYVTAFFDEHLRGEDSPLMDEPAAEWPEVLISHRHL
ncbi:platelet-activating factor acetylhydrolase [Stachybotrys elegans]|uniref:1-alkyl-2-acetylglycerophosphocholine esterase n=1 Tax=Stachybotrys elegans TaxID=80388 RepID=A0A8K0WLS6_9HYPO|nr:platelet-activating factor acetylhydrolase [Stachybotrys elegans]